jgi:hypothetical protein
MKQIMTDLETMSRKANAAIVSIGACSFDENGIQQKFYTTVNLESCIDLGLHVEQSTVDWWNSQPAEARAAWQVANAPPLEEALNDYTAWIKSVTTSPPAMWANGPDFDLVILKYAYEAIGQEPPWPYWTHRCVRTLKNILPTPHQHQGVKHHALDDAMSQANLVVQIMNARGLQFE